MDLRRIALILAALAVMVSGCGGSATPVDGSPSVVPSTSDDAAPSTTSIAGDVDSTTTTGPAETSPWVEVSGEGFEPDLRFEDVEPPHMAVVAAVLGRKMTEEDTEGLSEGTGAYAGLWTNGAGTRYWVGVAGPDAEAIAGRAAATAEYLGASVTVLVGRFTYDEINGAIEYIVSGPVPFESGYSDIMENRAVVTVAAENEAAMRDWIADLPEGLVLIDAWQPPEAGDVGEITYACGPVRATADGELLLDPLDEVARGALDVLLSFEEGSWLPTAGWGIGISEPDRLVLGARAGDEAFFAEFQPDMDGNWMPAGWGGCAVEAVTPGYGAADWEAAAIDGSTLTLSVTERACANGEVPEGRRVEAVVAETGAEVAITVFIEPVAGEATCPGNPSFPLEVTLDEPLGDRVLVDGGSGETKSAP
ncbi:MAG: hypothetical protein AB1Z55_10150 [Acidimicrobiia bacterium]